MKTLKKNWTRLASALCLLCGAIITAYACLSAWGQTAPGLNIAASNGLVSLTVTNGVTNGLYQIYFNNNPANSNGWVLFTNGATGQTNFSAEMGDTEVGYFKAINNNTFAPPAIIVIIQSPANGSVVH